MDARWEQIAQSSSGLPGTYTAAGGLAKPPMQWVAVDGDDEVLAYVHGAGQLWNAHFAYTGLSSSTQQGTFLSVDAGKRRVEKWLAPKYVFPKPANWAYQVGP